MELCGMKPASNFKQDIGKGDMGFPKEDAEVLVNVNVVIPFICIHAKSRRIHPSPLTNPYVSNSSTPPLYQDGEPVAL